MVRNIFLIALVIIFMALSYEVGFCHGYEKRDGEKGFKKENEKFVKGESNEQKSD